MKITSFGHCCLLLEIRDTRILIDPGAFSEGFTELQNIQVILITHEHGDHLHSESLKKVLRHNPEAEVICNASVGALLDTQEIMCIVLPDKSTHRGMHPIPIKAYAGQHAEIIGDFGLVENTGFLIDDTFFYPGDAYTIPEERVQVLAAPVAGPWCKIAEAIAYMRAVQPHTVIPVHDAVLSAVGKQGVYAHCERELKKEGIGFATFEQISTPIPTISLCT